MVSSYKNPTRIVRKVEEVATAWEHIAPAAEFSGMSANIARRADADEATNSKLKLVVNSVKGHPTYGENSDLYRPWAM